MKRYGKGAAGILGVGQNFFAENDRCLRAARRHAELYLRQPRRTRCKLCEAALPAEPHFRKLGIPYATCATCGQLNGMHEDTAAFCEAVYLDEDYAAYYAAADAERYAYRRDAIYRPKVDFLVNALAEAGRDPGRLSYADFGAGSGYMVAALLAAGHERVRGAEISPDQVAFATRMIGRPCVERIALDEATAYLRRIDAEVVCMIGVLEHLREPREALRALRDNRAVEFLYLCVPLFGLCVFLEAAAPHVYPRHLVSDHTHLFTPRSLAWMEAHFGFTRQSEWWFGSDMIDLYRQVLVTLDGDAATRGMTAEWTQRMRALIDPMQLVVDQAHLASEVHLVLRIER